VVCITVSRRRRTYPVGVFFASARAMSAPAPKSATPKTAPPRKIPEKIGKYVVIKEVGRGSTGIVYLSHDAYYGRDVAIKVYNQ
jgi:serine/threonine protein kinase